MNSKRGLMTALVGLAMLATPIAAAAHDYNHYDHAAHAAHEFRPGRSIGRRRSELARLGEGRDVAIRASMIEHAARSRE